MEFEAVKRQYLSQQVAEGILQRIIKGIFQPGEKLPSERELSQIFLVTRTTVREALKILQALRLVRIRQGEGVKVEDFMKTGSVELLGELLFLDGKVNKKALQDILEARVLFGRTVAMLAARRATPQDISDFEETLKKLKSAEGLEFQELDWELFRTLTKASNNLVFIFVMNSISWIYFRHWEAFSLAYQKREWLVTQYERLLEALKKADEDVAARVVSEVFEEQRKTLLGGIHG